MIARVPTDPEALVLELPLASPRAARTDGDSEVFHSFSRAVCPTCMQLVDGQRILRGGKVYLRKQCPRDGRTEALISSDAGWWLRSLTFLSRGSVPLQHSTSVVDGCPADCGLCPDHEQHSCLPIVEITNHCNLECPICIVQNRDNYMMTRAEFAGIVDGLIAKEGTLDTVNLSGGEPTLHPEFLAFCDLARRPGISRVSVVTNGLRCAAEPEFCRELARRNVYVNLQFDGPADLAVQSLRGGGDQLGARRRALDNLEAAGVSTTIVATLARGVNEDQIGALVRLLFERKFLLSLLFQPAAYTGTGGAQFGPHDPLDVVTIPEVVKRAAEQSGGLLRQSDFLPLPCSHPGCFALTYLLDVGDGFVPFPRFVELDPYLRMITNRGTIRPDGEFEQAFQDTINNLWSSSGQIPEGDRILRALKKALRLLFPEDRVLAFEERLRAGEKLVKSIFIHAFMDAHTFEVERIRKCCTHYALPDGRLMPGCAYNLFHRHRDERFVGPRGTPAR